MPAQDSIDAYNQIFLQGHAKEIDRIAARQNAGLCAPQRITLSRKKGFDLQTESHTLNGLPAVIVTRPGPWGNPFSFTEQGKAHAVEQFRRRVYRPNAADYRARIRQQLAGKNLACWCKEGEPCHADVLLAIANGPDYPCHDMAPSHWCDREGVRFTGHICVSTPYADVCHRLEYVDRTGEHMVLSGAEGRLIYGRLCRLQLLEEYLRGGRIANAVALAAKAP